MVSKKHIQVMLRAPFGVVMLVFEYVFVVFFLCVFFPAAISVDQGLGD